MRYSLLLTSILLLAACSGTSESPDGGPADTFLTEGFRFPDTVAHENMVTPPTDGGPTDGGSTGDIDPNDTDGDKIPNAKELALGLDPNNSDTDNDGIPDGKEVGDINNPKDSDGDGKIDAIEPDNFDSDGDKINDSQDKKDEDGECRKGGSKGPPRLFYNAIYLQPLHLTKACSPYKVLGHLWLISGAKLTSQAGVEVRFGPGAVLKAGNNSTKGHINLTGQSGQVVKLTADSKTPKKGYWRGVVVENGGEIGLQHTDIAYAGFSTSANPSSTVYIKLAEKIALSNSAFSSTSGYGLHAAFEKAGGKKLFSVFKNNKFSGLKYSAAVNLRHLGEIEAGNDFGKKGAGGEIHVHGTTLTKSATWVKTGVPFVLQEKTLNINADLTVSAGSEFIVKEGTVITVGYTSQPKVRLLGSPSSRITFTPVKAIGGSWHGLMLHGGSHTFHHVTIAGGGKANSQGINSSLYVDKPADVAVKGAQIKDGTGYGVYYYRSSNGCPYTKTNGFSFSKIVGCKFYCLDDYNSPGTCMVK